MCSPGAWAAAAQTATTSSLSLLTPGDDAAWEEMQRSGVASGRGELDPHWREVIHQTMTAPVTFRVASTYRGLAYLADIAVGTHVTTSLTRRLRVEDDGSGFLTPTGADPQLEFAVAGPDQVWPLVRRVLPPLEELRASPRETRDADRVEHPLDADTLRAIRASLDAPGLAPAARDALNAHATVMMMTLVLPPGAPADAPGVAHRAWALGDEGLYVLDRRDDEACVTRVTPGDIGFTTLWLAQGAQDALAHAARAFEGATS